MPYLLLHNAKRQAEKREEKVVWMLAARHEWSGLLLRGGSPRVGGAFGRKGGKEKKRGGEKRSVDETGM